MAPWTPTASASSRWLASCPRFSETSTSQTGSDPPAAARASSKARLIVLDNRYVPGSNHPISHTTEAGDTYQRRTLSNGRSFEILKNFPDRRQFTADVAAVAADVRWTQLRYYWLATCELR